MSKELVAEKPKSEVALIFEKINSGLVAFEERKSKLVALVAETSDLTVSDINDRATISKVIEGRKKLKKERVSIQNEGKALRDPLTTVNRQISAKESELVAITEPEEERLQKIEDWVDSEKERIKQEEIQKEEKRIQGRIDTLAQYGYGIDINFLKALSDEEFDKVVANAKSEYEKELAAKAEKEEAERKQREQDERDRQELKALRAKQEEADRLLREREAEIERKEAELKRQQEEAEREKRREEEAVKAAKVKGRIGQLEAIGMRFHGHRCFYNEDLTISYDQICSMEDDVFEKAVGSLSKAIEALKKEEERERKEMEDRIRREAAEKALADEKQRQEEAERQKAEELAQASDKAKFEAIIAQYEGVNFPEMKSAKHKKLLSEVKELNAKIIAHIKAKA